jgi:ribosome-binding factor A
MKETRRTRQVADVIRAELVRLIRDEVHDPEVGFATITGVEMTPDLKTARVFISVLGPAEQFAKTVAALNKARGFLRGPVGRNCGLKFAPELAFAEDHSLERGARIEELLREIHKSEVPEDPAKEEK